MRNDYAQTIPADWQDYSRLFAALGDPERQRILLTFEPGESLNVTELTRASSLSRPTVSHHLKLLCEAGVLERTRQGREIHFRLQADTLIQRLQTVIDYLDAHR
ncbi:MAG: metalloregulator ArsR/SmtB family transcription factor [Methyloversatilis sp.]|jgi:ArsR family transcriptional regulator, arsenate/arsenite/antimonite-responsive transcriptional repressor|uniref:ArsR/SmtB family transcription factor n=1 Tax=Methyloversatilis sp. TaxID=2569862 RepID=UPI0025DBDB30|nr:metalloregulator ArsR/SmtB family transcription factor [Methyloversatilis sp.]MCR6668185.1 metalloregulator ArsR/SmtB family transcription factor [Methyloversatilis sp.]